jgi:hypothetical protein
MTPEGAIRLRVRWDGRQIRAVAIESTRPAAARALCGRRAEAAPQIVARLFSVCARAQTVACVGAVEAAQGREPDVAAQRLRERVVLAESLHELLWRVVLDWPPLQGERADVAPFAALRRVLQRALTSSSGMPRWWDDAAAAQAAPWPDLVVQVDDFLERHVFGLPAREWGAMDRLADFEAWLARAQTVPARLLAAAWRSDFGASEVPALSALGAPGLLRELARASEDAGFAMRPTRAGRPAETGSLGRVGAHPLVAAAIAARGASVAVRLLARLADLAGLARALRAGLDAPAADAGVRMMIAEGSGERAGAALVETARGLLVHHASLAPDGEVTDYRIVAPTEWNFHPEGAFPQGLCGLASASAAAAEAAARMLAHALDPCVAFEVSLEDA